MSNVEEIASQLDSLYGTELTERLVTAVHTEQTVNAAMLELRNLLPQFKSRVITFYDAEPGAPYVSITLYVDDDCEPERAFLRFTLGEAMAQVREWASAERRGGGEG